mmetsp:Transcript_38536/g.43169  ORF Transcript_38536/g.43169 Transcript_38536/m.43169 type:complete len:1130 (+) Transcript_38536:207-3596(+)
MLPHSRFAIGALLLTTATSFLIHTGTADATPPDCTEYYPIATSGRRAKTFSWTNNGGSDSEWMNANNWNKSYLPGSNANDRLIMAVNDKATVTCPAAEYMGGKVQLTMRAGATLEVSSKLKPGKHLTMKSATVTQRLGGIVNIGNDLKATESYYNLESGAILNVGGNMKLGQKSELSVQMEGGTNFSASSLTLTGKSTLHITLNPTTTDIAAGYVRDSFVVMGKAKLIVDASPCSSTITGTVRIPLIEFGSITGTFKQKKISVVGLPDTMSTEIDVASGRLDLIVTNSNTPTTPLLSKAPTKPPTNYPTESPSKNPTNYPSESLSKNPTNYPSESPSKNPTKSLTESPSHVHTNSKAPTGMPTPNPTISPSIAPTTTAIDTGSPTTIPKTCHPVVSGGNAFTYFNFQNDGIEDLEWNNVKNWFQKDYLPGSQQNDKVILAANDKAIISCSASNYMSGDITILMRVQATLNIISSDLKIGNLMRIDGRSELTQMGPGGNVDISKHLTVTDSTYKMSVGDVTLFVGGTMTLNLNSKLVIEGEGSSFEANALLLDNSVIDIALGQSVQNTPLGEITTLFTVINGRLKIDMAAYSPIAGIVTTIPIIQFRSMVGTFPPENIVISGLSRAYYSDIKVTSTGLNLLIDATATSYPPPLTIGHQLVVTLSANGCDPIVADDSDVTIDSVNGGLVIDALDFTGDPGTHSGTLPILDWSPTITDTHTRFYLRHGEFDPKNIEFRNFDNLSGLWFELQYGEDIIQLAIKSLTDYSEYSQSKRYDSYDGYSDEADSSRFPEYSWENVSRWTNARKNTVYTDIELDILANNNAIVKVASLAGYATLEEGTIATAKVLREKNENLKIFCYWNSFVYWGTYRASDTFNKNNWLRYDNTGKLLNIGTNGVDRYVYNHDKSGMREWWKKTAVDLVSETVFDGIFIDKTADPRDEMTDGHRQMITELANELPSDKVYIGNALRQMSMNGARDRLSYMDGSYMENWTQGIVSQEMSEIVTVSIQLAREALSKQKMVWWTSGPWRCGWPCDVNEQEFREGIDMPLAIFLMIAEPNAYFNYQKETLVQPDAWKWDSSSLPEFGKDLGAPKGPPIKVGNTFVRHFEYLTVELDMDAETAVLNWHEGDIQV